MISFIRVIWLAAAVVLLALLPPARPDTVTWAQYKNNFGGLRTLGPRPDNDATTLALESSEITEIKPGDFDGLPNLIQIRLDHNKIHYLDAALFSSVRGLRVLALQYNDLTEVPNFGELSLFPNMTKLKLNSNQISKLDDPKVFASMVNLEYLHLQKNRIEHLHPDIFKALTKLISVTLNNNKITFIPEKMFHIPSLQRIYLNNNLISFVAPEAISSGKLQKLYLEHNRLTHLSEHIVIHLKNSSASFNYMGMHDNPWQCGCLRELTADADRTGVDYFFQRGCEATDSPCHRPTQSEALASGHVLENNQSKS